MICMPVIASKHRRPQRSRLLTWAAISIALHLALLPLGWALLSTPVQPGASKPRESIQVSLVSSVKMQTAPRRHPQAHTATKPLPVKSNNQREPVPDTRQADNVSTATATLPANTAATSTPAFATAKLQAAHFTQILHQAIDRHKHYPVVALRMRQQGIARIRFRLFEDGRIEDITLLHTSGHRSLDHSALLAVQSIAPFTPARKYLSNDEQFYVDIVFRI
jgi:periplasmic protein TonB